MNKERIIKIGKELSQTEFTKTNYTQITDVVMAESGLREKMTELQKNATEFEYKIVKGDFEKPFGNNRADAVLTIITNYQNIGIRIKYDKRKDKYHILGWMILNNETD